MKPEAHSIQHQLNRWIIMTSSAFMVFGGLLSASIVFKEATDIQDSLLREIASLVRQGNLGDNSASRNNNKGEELSILIQPVDAANSKYGLHLPENLVDGLQTLTLDGESWRVLVIKQTFTGEKYLIAQQTELRNDLALASGLNVFLPMLGLVIFMLVIIRWMIRHLFKPVDQLVNQLLQQNELKPEPLTQQKLPTEIAPFVAAINDLLNRIRTTLHKQQRFISDAAHELRTPVTALSLMAENLQKATTETVRRQRQQQLKESLERLRWLLNQLLDMARLQSDAQNPMTPVSLKQIIQQTIADLYPLAEKSAVDLGVTRLQDITVQDQDDRLQQLVRNAIDNAILYTPAGGQINISLYLENDQAVFCVEDSGQGIPQQALGQVFEPFYRCPQNSQPGNGLGLAISQEIAQRLQGQIKLQNLAEGGLRFSYRQSAINVPSRLVDTNL